ncbi:unnamed protein product [Linum tenue]|uniref:DNA-directed RNA polymerase III subunit RPC3 n=1 Tax=Linum tenue TaxID=586396 RepID=A0AAV0LGV5_9ROSI|nr:unnamed protein product [Linum tenue]
MVSQHGILYAVHLITNQFGNLVAKVCECLLRNGALTLQAIVRRTELSPAKVRNCLLVLIQHNCAQAFILEESVSGEDAGEPGKALTQYIALFVNILHRVRFSKFMDVVSKELGGSCGELFRGLLEHGRLTVKQIVDRAGANAKESTNTVQEDLGKLVMAHYVECCPAPEPLVPPPDADTKKRAKSSKVMVEPLTLEQRVMAVAMPSAMRRFSFVPNADQVADDQQNVNQPPSKDVGEKRKLHDLESDTALEEEVECNWRANFEELLRRLRHKTCVDTIKVRFDDAAATVLSAMLEASRAEEDKVKTANSVPLSLNTIYEEVVKNEKNHSMTFDHVRTCLEELSCPPTFVKTDDESYSIDFTKITEAAQSEEIESIVLKRFGETAYKIFRLLFRAGCLMETDKIADRIFAEKKETSKTLFKMWQDGYLLMEKLVVGGTTTGPSYGGSSYLLWKVNKRLLRETILDEMFHAALNLNLRLAHEIDQNKEVLNLPPDKREGPDKQKFDRLRNVRLLIHSSLMKLDDAIMLFHDF